MVSDKTQQVDLVCRELGKILTELMEHPAPQGQKVIIHISRNRDEVWIEKPPQMVRIATN